MVRSRFLECVAGVKDLHWSKQKLSCLQVEPVSLVHFFSMPAFGPVILMGDLYIMAYQCNNPGFQKYHWTKDPDQTLQCRARTGADPWIFNGERVQGHRHLKEKLWCLGTHIHADTPTLPKWGWGTSLIEGHGPLLNPPLQDYVTFIRLNWG